MDENIENVVSVKSLLSIDDVMERVQMMKKFEAASNLAFDFSGLQYVTAIPAMLFARELRLLIHRRLKKGLKTFGTGHDEDKSAALGYLGFIGFFDFIGLDGIGSKVRSVAEVHGKSNPYLAITKYNYQRFKVAAEFDPYRSEYDYIAEEANKIAELLGTVEVRNKLFGYAVCEVLRNSYEHSGASDFYAMGQSWPDGALELVIMDDGCGILKTLKDKYPRLATETEAIREAMRPGVSGSDFTKDNRYNNSGFGLYVLSEFAKRHGAITIVSGKDLVSVSSEQERCEELANDGTFVGIYLKEVPKSATEEIEKIIAEGEKISMQSEYPVRPSKTTFAFRG